MDAEMCEGQPPPKEGATPPPCGSSTSKHLQAPPHLDPVEAQIQLFQSTKGSAPPRGPPRRHDGALQQVQQGGVVAGMVL